MIAGLRARSTATVRSPMSVPAQQQPVPPAQPAPVATAEASAARSPRAAAPSATPTFDKYCREAQLWIRTSADQRAPSASAYFLGIAAEEQYIHNRKNGVKDQDTYVPPSMRGCPETFLNDGRRFWWVNLCSAEGELGELARKASQAHLEGKL